MAKDKETEKPELLLVRPPFTADSLAQMFRRLTGREPTAEGMAEFQALEDELKAEQS